VAAVAFGAITLVWHEFGEWQPLSNVPHREILAHLVAACPKASDRQEGLAES